MTIKTITDLKAGIASTIYTNTTNDVSGNDVKSGLDDTIDTIGSAHGWGFYVDTAHTSGSPLVVNNARVQLTNNALGATTETSYLPGGVTNLWAGDKITPQNVGDSYDLRVDFTAEMNSANGFANISLDIGDGGSIEIVDRMLVFPKGTGVATKFSIGVPIFSLGTFVTNGGKIYLDTTDGADDMDVYDIGIFIGRNSKGV